MSRAQGLIADAEQLMNNGDKAGAVRMLRWALKGSFTGAANWRHLGVACDRAGQWQQAVQAYRRALQIAPGSAEDNNELGNASAALGQDQAAQAAYTRAVALPTEEAVGHINFGSLLLARGETAQATESFTRARSLDPTLANTHYLLGCAALAAGDFEVTLAHCDACLSIESYAPDALALRAIALNELGRDAESNNLVGLRTISAPRDPKPPCQAIRTFGALTAILNATFWNIRA
jgi:Flp pilus assembly protein TadD